MSPITTRERLDVVIRKNPLPDDDGSGYYAAAFWLASGSAIATGLAAYGTLGVGVAALVTGILGTLGVVGGGCLVTIPSRQRRRADTALSNGIAAIAKELPAPGPSATAEERIIRAHLARKAVSAIRQRTLTPEAQTYVDALQKQAEDLQGPILQRTTEIVEMLVDEEGASRDVRLEFDALTVALSSLEAGERSRVLAVLRPLIDPVLQRYTPVSPWRAQALAGALEGKEFRYGDLATEASAGELPALHPSRLAFDRMDTTIAKLLRQQAAARVMNAQVWLPPQVTHDQAVRLAAKYEALDYRVFLHPLDNGVLFTLCTKNHVPNAEFIVGRTERIEVAFTPPS